MMEIENIDSVGQNVLQLDDFSQKKNKCEQESWAKNTK